MWGKGSLVVNLQNKQLTVNKTEDKLVLYYIDFIFTGQSNSNNISNIFYFILYRVNNKGCEFKDDLKLNLIFEFRTGLSIFYL